MRLKLQKSGKIRYEQKKFIETQENTFLTHLKININYQINPYRQILQLIIQNNLIHQMSQTLLRQLTTGQLSHSGIVQHLTQLIREQISNKSQLKGMSNLEVFSYYLRKNQFNFQQFIQDQQLNVKMSQPKLQSQYVKSFNTLDNKIKQLNIKRPYQKPNLMQQYYVLKQCGVSIGETNYLHLTNVLKMIATEYECNNVRFWGKIIGYKDYFVIQGTSTKKYLNELGADSENYGTGINTYSYWVANCILGQWTELPLVTPTQVKQSRNLKYIFSGNLQNQINLMSKFNGKEKHLLKCVIARITHSCELIPKGLYKLNQENPNIVEFEQQFKLPQVADMNSLQSWVHANSHILNQGRESYYIDPKLTQEEKQALIGQFGQSDPMVERFKGITEDKPYQTFGYTTNWTVQLCGQTIPMNLVGKQQGQSTLYASVLLRNLVWPGAVTVGYKGGWTNIYIGHGHRISQVNSLIKQLDNLQVEGESRKQYPQPNPSKPPVVQQQKPAQQQDAPQADD